MAGRFQGVRQLLIVENLGLGAGLCHAYARFQSSDDLQKVPVSILEIVWTASHALPRGERQRDIRVRAYSDAEKPWRCDTNNGEGHTMDAYLPAQNHGVTRKPALPIREADHGHRRIIRNAIILGSEGAPDQCLQPKDRIVIRRDEFRVRNLSLPAYDDAKGPCAEVSDQPGKRAVVVAKLLEHRVGKLGHFLGGKGLTEPN